jgi:hypothetical protein
MGVLWSTSLLQVVGAEKPALLAVPESALLGMPVSIQGKGFRPGEEVILRARSEDGNKVSWESSALFLADKKGILDTSKQAPLSGDYSSIDPAGLFWSMKPQGLEKKDWWPYSFKNLERMTVTLTAETGGRIKASSLVERLIRSPESKLVRESIRADGLVATLFYPAEGGPHPALVNLGGSGGGLSEQWEGLVSSYGYAVLALAYFGVEPLPQECVEIPLEYFGKALNWLKAHKAVDPERLAVAGGSKGAELALLLGAVFPEFKAVVGIAPSALVWQGISRKSFEPRSSWSRDGKGLPFAPFNLIWADVQKLMRKEPLAFIEWYNPQKLNPEIAQAAAIEVERINGPVLLLSGSDDQMWPSAVFAEMVMRRLKEHGHPFPDQAICFEGSGHIFRLPYLPTTANQTNRQFIVGGNPQADAQASLGAWKAILDFLNSHLRRSTAARGF